MLQDFVSELRRQEPRRQDGDAHACQLLGLVLEVRQGDERRAAHGLDEHIEVTFSVSVWVSTEPKMRGCPKP